MADQQPVNIPVDLLPLGRDPMGRAWSLHLGTGAVEAAPIQTLIEGINTEIVPASEISGTWVARVLAEGGWSVTLSSETAAESPSHSVVTEIGTVTVAVTGNGRRVHFTRVYRWDTEHADWATPEDRAIGAEGLNGAAYVVRFATTEEPAELAASLDIPTHAGITRAQLLQYLRRFVHETIIVLRATDIEEVVR